MVMKYLGITKLKGKNTNHRILGTRQGVSEHLGKRVVAHSTLGANLPFFSENTAALQADTATCAPVCS